MTNAGGIQDVEVATGIDGITGIGIGIRK